MDNKDLAKWAKANDIVFKGDCLREVLDNLMDEAKDHPKAPNSLKEYVANCREKMTALARRERKEGDK